MKKIFLTISFFAIALAMLSSCGGEKKGTTNDEVLPIDPKVTVGTLENGMKYYIRENKKPENRVELMLVVNAGAILEDEDQNGLAHFCEHMLFNGTKNFPKDKLVSFLESTGMKFGADVNAGTSWDYTQYMLQLPADNKEQLDKGFQVLEDWAHQASFDGEEIDKERGVIIEEWRVRSGAQKRIRDKQFAVLLKDSKYVTHDVIGDTNILRTFKYETIKRFYKDWYRPDLMAVVAVGDFDKKEIEKKIKEEFSKIPNPEKPRERKIFDIPSHKEPRAVIARDKELPYSNLAVYFKKDKPSKKTYSDYRMSIVRQLYDKMFAKRLQELQQKSEPPFINAFGGFSQFIGEPYIYYLGAQLHPNKVKLGIEAALTEAFRVVQHGFTQTELDREKTDLLEFIKKYYNERETTPSRRYAREYTSNFLNGEPIPGIEKEYELYQKYIPKITLEDVNALAKEYITKENCVFTLALPDKEDVVAPSEEEMLAMFNSMFDKKLPAYEDKVSDKPLLKKKPAPGEIKEEKEIKEIGVTELTLSNGVKVILKPTDFKKDEIIFNAFSPGGHSLAPDSDYISASMAAQIIDNSGVGEFDLTSLQKKLTGKMVNVSPYIDDILEGMSGKSTPQDLETMFELIYLYFTAPRMDDEAFKSFVEKTKSSIKDRGANPDMALRDTVRTTMAGYNYRARPLTIDIMKELDHKKAFDFYKDRFADASDFTFVLVGNFDIAKMKELVKMYLGGLPSINREESWKDNGIDLPKGKDEKKVTKGIMDKSTVWMIYSGDFDWNLENRYLVKSLVDVLTITLRENVREEKSGTYGVSLFPQLERYPDGEYKLSIYFGCDPARVDELVATAVEQVKKAQASEPEASYMQKVKEMHKRSFETNLKENKFWMQSLYRYYFNGLDPKLIVEYPKMVEKLTAKDIQEAAKKYFDPNNMIKFVLYPEKQK